MVASQDGGNARMVAFRKPLAASNATDSPSGGTATLSNGHLNHPIRSSHRACIENLSAEAQDGGTGRCQDPACRQYSGKEYNAVNALLQPDCRCTCPHKPAKQ
jgi:hypothetical protein